jgi:hypothetical protein
VAEFIETGRVVAAMDSTICDRKVEGVTLLYNRYATYVESVLFI